MSKIEIPDPYGGVLAVILLTVIGIACLRFPTWFPLQGSRFNEKLFGRMDGQKINILSAKVTGVLFLAMAMFVLALVVSGKPAGL